MFSDDNQPAIDTHFYSRLWRQYWFSLTVLILIVALMFVPLSWQEALTCDHQALLDGQWWRLFSGHLLHLSANHALLNLAGYGLVVLILREALTPLNEIVIVLLAMLAVGFGLHIYNPELDLYYGFSGVLHALMVAGALLIIPKQLVLGLGFLMFVVLKLWREQHRLTLDESLQSFIGGPVAYDAHLYGAVAGLLIGIVLLMLEILKRERVKLGVGASKDN